MQVQQQQRLRIGKIYQKNLILEILKTLDTVQCKLFLYGLSPHSRSELVFFHRLIMKYTVDSFEMVHTKELYIYYKNDILEAFKDRDEYRKYSVVAQTFKQCIQFLESIINIRKIKVKNVTIDTTQTEDDYQEPSDVVEHFIALFNFLQIKSFTFNKNKTQSSSYTLDYSSLSFMTTLQFTNILSSTKEVILKPEQLQNITKLFLLEYPPDIKECEILWKFPNLKKVKYSQDGYNNYSNKLAQAENHRIEIDIRELNILQKLKEVELYAQSAAERVVKYAKKGQFEIQTIKFYIYTATDIDWIKGTVPYCERVVVHLNEERDELPVNLYLDTYDFNNKIIPSRVKMMNINMQYKEGIQVDLTLLMLLLQNCESLEELEFDPSLFYIPKKRTIHKIKLPKLHKLSLRKNKNMPVVKEILDLANDNNLDIELQSTKDINQSLDMILKTCKEQIIGLSFPAKIYDGNTEVIKQIYHQTSQLINLQRFKIEFKFPNALLHSNLEDRKDILEQYFLLDFTGFKNFKKLTLVVRDKMKFKDSKIYQFICNLISELPESTEDLSLSFVQNWNLPFDNFLLDKSDIMELLLSKKRLKLHFQNKIELIHSLRLKKAYPNAKITFSAVKNKIQSVEDYTILKFMRDNYTVDQMLNEFRPLRNRQKTREK